MLGREGDLLQQLPKLNKKSITNWLPFELDEGQQRCQVWVVSVVLGTRFHWLVQGPGHPSLLTAVSVGVAGVPALLFFIFLP